MRDEFPQKIINIHPALLPSFPRLDAQKQTFDYGVKYAGCTVHFVDNEIDHGPIILQAIVPVLEDDTYEDLKQRIKSFKPNLVGVTMMSFRYKDHYALVKRMKEEFKGIDIVAGGPHVSTFREKALSDCPSLPLFLC